MPALTSKQVSLHLKAVPNWLKRAQAIRRTFKFEGFLKGIAFVNRIAKKAQRNKHHPDIDIRFNQVTLTLTQTTYEVRPNVLRWCQIWCHLTPANPISSRKSFSFKHRKAGGRGGIRRPSTSGDPKIKAGFTSVRKQTYL